MPFQVMLPEEALLAEVALVSANLIMTAVHVCAEVSSIEEAFMTDAAVELVGANMKSLVFDVARI